MKRIRPLNRFWLLLFFIIPFAVFAQDRTITGKVVDEMNQPLPGASVKVTGGASTSTDVNGTFRVRVSGDAVTLSIAFIGYATKEVTLTPGQTNIDISLEPGSRSLEEVVVVGYGTQRKRDVTGSVVSVKGETLREVPTANIQQALQGRAPGVEVQNIGTRPGANAQIRIRGERSITGSNDPLIVVDGIPFSGSLNDINTYDIESTEVLKDASATAIYGSRGANGVILVTMKRGAVGPTRISFNSYYGAASVTRKYPVYDADQYRRLRDISPFNGGYQPEELEGIAQGRNIDWQDLIYKNGYMTDNNLSIQGGSEQSQFSIGGGYFKQTAVLPGQDFGRYSLRATGDFKIGKRVKIGLTSLNQLGITNGSQFGINVFPMITLSPLMPPYNADGSVNVKPAGNLDDKNTTYNPLLLLQNPDSWVDRVRRGTSFNSVYGEVQIIDGLKYRFNGGFNWRQEEGAQFRGTDSYFRPGTYNQASVDNSTGESYTMENLVIYEKTLAKKHRISATGLYSIQRDRVHNTFVGKDSITADFTQFYNLALSNVTPVATLGGGESTSTILSYMARINYVYDDKYMITVTGRRDGSSRLGLGNKWKQYPAVSAGWVISNESFLQSIKQISALKLRAGYGETSNQSVAAYSTLGGVTSGPRYNFGPTQYTGYYINRIVDPNLDWEYTRTLNLGLDFGVLNNRITGTIDWYNSKTDKILYAVTLPPTSGIAEPFLTNIGKMSNRGLEVALSSVNIKNKRDFNWSTDINFFFNRNKLERLNGNVTKNINNQLFVGQPLTVIYDYKKLGIWQLDEAEAAAKYGAIPGQIKIEDNNGVAADGTETGLPDGKIDDKDMRVLGSGEAKIQGGITNRFSYKGFDLSVVAYGRFGGLLVSQVHQPLAGYLAINDGRRNQIAVDYWTPTNPTNEFPMPQASINGAGAGTAWTTLGYFDATFVRIRSINFGYTFSNEIIQKVGAKSLRLYATAQNPFILFSPYVKAGGVDPEPTGTGNQGVGNPGNLSSRALTIGGGYPPTRSLLFGLNLSF